MRYLFIALVLTLGVAAPLAAQTNIRVLGVGQVAMDFDTIDTAQAQSQSYKAYMPDVSTASIALTVTCGGPGTGAPTGTRATCVFPLSALPLLATFQTLALTASVAAPDGTLEGAKGVAPFALALAGPPVAPRVAMRIRPATQ